MTQCLEQRSLADPGLPGDEGDPAVTGARFVDVLDQ
jgi:hypothetical protein